ncbi:MAG TPA: 3-hydroxybutyrate oligomer hydrolase family protein [Steroidobacteraceae bacterium]|nr:3-hydroxybutyrate oligomer hydrolase family protein [Steroidobacteraceae bacterium]HNS27727.1 3-hydroxybutyrate oligomer hydrolase family protein [Steroidobacteraceae bacterium]
MTTTHIAATAAAAALVVLAGCTAGSRLEPAPRATGSAAAAAVHRAQRVGEPIRYEFDGVTDDLLTAGLGAAGLLGPAPGFADARNPGALELRRRAIYMNYRGLADLAAAPGGGSAVAGVELLVGLYTPETGASTAMLQIPRDFDTANPCLVAVASSGSRGIYGALATAGGWGLRHGCAVVHTDKGTGSGVFEVAGGRGVRLDGTLGTAGDPLLSFAPDPAAVARLAAQRPQAVLFRHANSGVNVEAHWGEYLLQAIDVAFALLNREYPDRAAAFEPANTLVIAAGISNGGGTVLHALERDVAGWIDGAVVSEPNVSVPDTGAFGYPVRPLYELVLEHLLLQPCAVLADEDATAPFRAATVAARPALEQWCRDLVARGELPAGEPDAIARAARDRLIALGIEPDALRLGHVNVHASLWSAVAVAYTSAYARLPPDELPCGVSFAATDAAGQPRALADEELARFFADSTGIAPTAGVNLVAADASGTLRVANFGSIDLALCLRGLHDRVAPGLAAARATPRADPRPVILMHGRLDGLVPVGHSSRPWFHASIVAGGETAGVRYYEIERGQHFDAFLPAPGFKDHYVAMQPYFDTAMDLMAAHLRTGSALPPSQVVRKGLVAAPGADAITAERDALLIPR